MEIQQPGTSFAEKGVSLSIYSEPGNGKTSLTKTLLGWSHDGVKVEEGKLISDGWDYQEPYCLPEEVLVLCADAGDSVLSRDDKSCCSIIYIKDTMADFKEIIDSVCSLKYPFKVILLDNVSELEKYFVLSLTKQRGLETPRQKEWGDASMYLRKYMRQLRDLVFGGKDMIFLYWSMDIPKKDKDGNLESEIWPQVMRTTKEEHVGLVEHCAYLGVAQKTNSRFLQFRPSGPYNVKTRSELVEKFEKANLTDVLRKMRVR